MDLKVNEIFYSIQGESTFAGFPFVFIRLSGCNLRCTWCDTEYAFTEGQVWSIDRILAEVDHYDSPFVEITGGEPLLQKNTPHLMQTLLEKGKTVLVETSGAVPIDVCPSGVKRIMDIKCPDSKMSDKMRWENIKYIKAGDEIKFVIASHRDFIYAENVVDRYPQLTNFPLLISPVSDHVSVQDVVEWIKNSKFPFRLQMQLHKIIWPGIEKGV